MFKVTFVFLGLLMGLQASAQQLYLASEDNGEKFFVLEASPYNMSGLLNNGALGFCISSEACSKEFKLSESYMKNLATSNGTLEIPQELQELYAFPDYDLKITTISSSKTSAEHFKLEVDSFMSNSGQNIFLGKQNFTLEVLPFNIEFNHTEAPISNRVSFEEIDSSLQGPSQSVFQIMGRSQKHGLGATSGGHGTAFFISDKGLALTNRHVLELYPECLTKRSCTMKIKQKGHRIHEYDVLANVLTCSQLNDFCLLSLKTDDQIKFRPLELGLKSISKKLLTLGFPADKSAQFIDDNNEQVVQVALTYSFGSPIGFSGTGVSASMFISQGASGSPVIDLADGKVVGLNSNGAQSFSPSEDGMPCIFRTLFLINKEFGISDYLTGVKQQRIEHMIMTIQLTNNDDEVREVLEKLSEEKSFYGRGKLEVISYSHKNVKIRKSLRKFLLTEALQYW